MDGTRLIALRVVREGYATLDAVMAMPTDLVMDAFEHCTFTADYESAYSHINQPDKQ